MGRVSLAGLSRPWPLAHSIPQLARYDCRSLQLKLRSHQQNCKRPDSIRRRSSIQFRLQDRCGGSRDSMRLCYWRCKLLFDGAQRVTNSKALSDRWGLGRRDEVGLDVCEKDSPSSFQQSLNFLLQSQRGNGRLGDFVRCDRDSDRPHMDLFYRDRIIAGPAY
jgi:hypothetical protein